MPLVVVCYKWVLDEADIRINADLSIDLSKAKGKSATMTRMPSKQQFKQQLL